MEGRFISWPLGHIRMSSHGHDDYPMITASEGDRRTDPPTLPTHTHRAKTTPDGYKHSPNTKTLFKKFLDFNTVVFLFLFDKYYLIIKYLGLKDLSRDLQINCIISYSFYLYLILHACAARFDVTENLVKFWVFGCI